MFMEASAKTRENVNDVFYELAEKILENPDLFESANRQRQGVNLDQQSDGWMSWLGGTISSWTGCQDKGQNQFFRLYTEFKVKECLI